MGNAKETDALPNLLVVGAQKAGSTWLHERLAAHPDIFMSHPKELRFFGHRDKTETAQGITDYKSEFTAGIDKRYRGESTPAYFWSHDPNSQYAEDLKRTNSDIPSVVARILGPDTALVVSLRNPVARAVSAFYHQYRAGNINANDSIRNRGHRWGIIDMGFYQRHIEAWLRCFPAERLHAVLFDDIAERPKQLVTNLYQWLDLPSEVGDPNLQLPSNQSASRSANESPGAPLVSLQDIRYLAQLYEKDIGFVEDYLSRKLPSWRSTELDDYL
ncbi:MAG: hypothetical protein ACI9DH_000244 [Halioglobus sp.]|jgi:hypothetical protein